MEFSKYRTKTPIQSDDEDNYSDATVHNRAGNPTRNTVPIIDNRTQPTYEELWNHMQKLSYEIENMRKNQPQDYQNNGMFISTKEWLNFLDE